jgi:hypothetical protein
VRHYLLLPSPGTVAPITIGMFAATATGRLVASRGRAPFDAPAFLGAALLTIDVAAIAA